MNLFCPEWRGEVNKRGEEGCDSIHELGITCYGDRRKVPECKDSITLPTRYLFISKILSLYVCDVIFSDNNL